MKVSPLHKKPAVKNGLTAGPWSPGNVCRISARNCEWLSTIEVDSNGSVHYTDTEWALLSSRVHEVASETLGLTQMCHQVWYDNCSTAIKQLLQQKCTIYKALLSDLHWLELLCLWKNVRAETQKQLRLIENKW